MKALNLCVLTCLTIFTHNTFAGPVISGGGTGKLANYLSCQNKNLSFLIRSTAAPTYIQGLLQQGSYAVNFECKFVNKDLAPNAPNAGKTLWECRELTERDDGTQIVYVEQSGLTGQVSAYLFQKQIYPLEPKALATLNCRK